MTETPQTTATTAAELEELIDDWRGRLQRLDPQRVRERPAPDRWTISEVIGHLIDSACNNHQRFVRAQFCSELEFPRYDQNQWVAAANYVNADWESLVALWYHYNRQLAILIRNTPEDALVTTCTITPNDACSLEFLITDYVAHLRHHLQILDERIR